MACICSPFPNWRVYFPRWNSPLNSLKSLVNTFDVGHFDDSLLAMHCTIHTGNESCIFRMVQYMIWGQFNKGIARPLKIYIYILCHVIGPDYNTYGLFPWLVPHVRQELLSRPVHLNSPTVVSGVRVTDSLYFCLIFCRSLFVPLFFFC
jgi:hypothetical protein